MYQNYIFDLYGTLVDVRTNQKKRYLWEKMAMFMRFRGADYSPLELKGAYRNGLAEQRKEKSSRISDAISEQVSPREIEVSFEELAMTLYAAKGVSVTREHGKDWAVMYRTISMEHLSLYEGAEELLKRLKSSGKRIYLLSNAQRIFSDPEMRTLGIYDYFDAIYYSSDVGFVKPSGRFYQKLLKEQKLNTKETVMVGNDAWADAWAAHDNGLDSIYIYTRQSPRPEDKLPDNCRKIFRIVDAFDE